MALGSRVGGGCNVWHLLGGIPVWAVGSLLFALGLLPGAWAGARLVAALAARATVPASGTPR